MLRESFHHMKLVLNPSITMYTGEIGFKLSNGRLPWSTLEGDLQKKGYTIVNWPQGVVRDRDKGVSGLSAEDADKLHDALFVDEQRLRFAPRIDGKFLAYTYTTGSFYSRSTRHQNVYITTTGLLRWHLCRAQTDPTRTLVQR